MKTPKEFDYDLWTTEDGKYMVRVKSTGEVTEVERDVMRVLRAEEKKMRRSFVSADTEENEEAVLSLDAICDSGEVDEAGWMIDTEQNVEAEIIGNSLYDEFTKILTPTQASVFKSCMINKVTVREYARTHNISHVAVLKVMDGIRKKYKKFFT